MQDEKTLKWQYIGIIVCVCIVLTLAVVSSFVFAVSPNVEVAEAYYSPSNNYVQLEYDYFSPNDVFDFEYGDNYEYIYTLSDFQSERMTFDFDDDDLRGQSAVPVCWTISLVLDDRVQTSPQSWFEFALYVYTFGSSTPTFQYAIADSSNYFTLIFETWGADCYFDLEFRDSSSGEEWCMFYFDEIEVAYIYDERSWNNGYNYGADSFFDSGYDIGYEDGSIDGYDNGYNVGFNRGYNDGYVQAGVDGADYSWQGMVSAIIDVPVRALVGKWEDANGDGQYELVGGLFNFYIPELDLNLAPILLSLITICVIVVILRFVFQFL